MTSSASAPAAHPPTTAAAHAPRGRVLARPSRVHVAWRRGALSWNWAALGVSIAVYAAVGVILHQPFHEGTRALRFFDLRIYRGAAARVMSGTGLYGAPIFKGFGFTYPPFAALVLAPLALIPFSVDQVGVTAINLALLVWVMRRALLIPVGRRSDGGTEPSDRTRSWSIAALAAAAALWLEPVSVTLGYGQINLLITALVVFDLSRPDRARSKGAAIGVAAALKLTPLMFLIYLLLSGRRRAALFATAVFAGSVGVAYAALGADAARYWGGGLALDVSRVGNSADVANQSLRGALARLGAGAQSGPTCLIVVVVISLTGLLLAARAARRGDEAAGFSLTAVSTLLASPISWTHHWTLAVPALLLLGRRAHRQRSRRLAGVTSGLTILGYAYAPEPLEGASLHPGLVAGLTGDPYVIAGLLALAAAAWAATRSRSATTDRTMTSETAQVTRAAAIRPINRRVIPVAEVASGCPGG